MKFFQYFPFVEYENQKATNITAAAKIRDVILKNSAVYYPYIVEDGDRPDILAHKYYGSSDYTWVILYANNINDPFYDWPMTDQVFHKYLNSKYEEVKNNNDKYKYEDFHGQLINGQNHRTIEFCQLAVIYYYDQLGNIIDHDDRQAAVSHETIYDYELRLNEEKRNIKIVDKNYLPLIINEMKVVFK